MTPLLNQPAPDEKLRIFQNKILTCRRQGMSFPAIANEFGMSQGWIYKCYKRALKAIIVENVQEVRALELARLDELQNEVIKQLQMLTPLVNSGRVVYDIMVDENGNQMLNEEGKTIPVRLVDTGPKLAAVNAALKIMERRARLLGLDTPTKVAMTNPDGDKEASLVQFYLPANGRDESSPTE